MLVGQTRTAAAAALLAVTLQRFRAHINCTILSLLTSRLAMDTANEVPDKLYSAL